MPKRSNEFQRLIRVIYEQLVPAGATVTESALVKERSSEVQREVDVLIEQPLADVTIRLAVECRDRSRTADVEWIDGLIGKYCDLPIDRVIAVSGTGFSQTAKEKGTANRIETRSLSNALSSDWPAELETLSLARFKTKVRLTRWGLTTVPPWQGDEPAAIRIALDTVPAKEILRIFERKPSDSAVDAFLMRAKTAAEFSQPWTESVTVEVPETPEAHAVGKDGSKAKLIRLSFLFEGSTEVASFPVSRRLYGSVGITSGTIHVPELQRAFKVTVVQAPGKNIARPIIEPLPDADRSYST